MDYGAKIGFSLQLSNFSNKNRLRHPILPPKQAEDSDFPNWFCFDYASIKTNFRSFVAVLFGRLWKFTDPSPRQASICGLTSSLIVNCF